MFRTRRRIYTRVCGEKAIDRQLLHGAQSPWSRTFHILPASSTVAVPRCRRRPVEIGLEHHLALCCRRRCCRDLCSKLRSAATVVAAEGSRSRSGHIGAVPTPGSALLIARAAMSAAPAAAASRAADGCRYAPGIAVDLETAAVGVNGTRSRCSAIGRAGVCHAGRSRQVDRGVSRGGRYRRRCSRCWRHRRRTGRGCDCSAARFWRDGAQGNGVVAAATGAGVGVHSQPASRQPPAPQIAGHRL